MWTLVTFGAVLIVLCGAKPFDTVTSPVISVTTLTVVSRPEVTTSTATKVINSSDNEVVAAVSEELFHSSTAATDTNSVTVEVSTTSSAKDASSSDGVTIVTPVNETLPVSSTESTDTSSSTVVMEVTTVDDDDGTGQVIARYPHAVLLQRTCGGSIIHPSWVLSAAHCTIFRRGRSVLAGTEHSLSGEGQLRFIKRQYLHPLFSVGPFWLKPEPFNISQVAASYDFLLSELEEPFVLDGKTVAAVSLDSEWEHPGGVEIGYAGYGAESHGESMRHELQARRLTTVEDSECAARLTQFDRGSMLCARGTPPQLDSACNGDSGSGLVEAKAGARAGGRLLGVLSWVEGDATRCFNGAVVVAARVAAARDWIRHVAGV